MNSTTNGGRETKSSPDLTQLYSSALSAASAVVNGPSQGVGDEGSGDGAVGLLSRIGDYPSISGDDLVSNIAMRGSGTGSALALTHTNSDVDAQDGQLEAQYYTESEIRQRNLIARMSAEMEMEDGGDDVGEEQQSADIDELLAGIARRAMAGADEELDGSDDDEGEGDGEEDRDEQDENDEETVS